MEIYTEETDRFFLRRPMREKQSKNVEPTKSFTEHDTQDNIQTSTEQTHDNNTAQENSTHTQSPSRQINKRLEGYSRHSRQPSLNDSHLWIGQC